jgi:translation initiation factor IF-2
MAGSKKIVRLSKAAREFNVGMGTIIDFLGKKGFKIEATPNFKLEPEMYDLLVREFQSEKIVKEIAHKKGLEYVGQQTISIEDTLKEEKTSADSDDFEPSDDLFIANANTAFGASKEKNVPSKPAEEEAPIKTTEAAPSDELPEKEEDKAQAAPAPVDVPKPAVEAEKAAPEKTEMTDEKSVVAAAPEVEEEKVTEMPAAVSEDKPAEKKEKEVKTKPVEQKPAEPESEPEVEPEPIAEAKVKAPKEVKEEPVVEETAASGPKVLGSIDLDSINQKTRPAKKSKAQKRKEAEAKKKGQKAAETKTEDKPKAAPKKEIKPAKEKPTAETAEVVEEQKEVLEEPKTENVSEKDENFIPTTFEKLSGPKILDKIELPTEKKRKSKPVASSSDKVQGKKKRRRIKSENKAADSKTAPNRSAQKGKGKEDRQRGKRKVEKRPVRHEPTEEEIQKQIKETLARLSPTGKSKSSKYRRQKRDHVLHAHEEELKKQEQEQSILKVTEFLTANEIANMMDVNVNDIIKTCMQLGLFVSINQRLDAETIAVLAEEYGHQVKFVDVDDHDALDVEEEEDDPKDLVDRAPIVTVMGHVDHGKTKLLDYIRNANVVAGEAGGITQHIGAYEVTTKTGKSITFLDTPGHEAFTAMRARGAKVTDVAIIVIAADDSVMPQTKEAINHAQAAGVPIVFAFNKIDKPTANVDRIKEQLANMNILVEDWGGKYQSQDVSAITGDGIPELLEKVLLESEMLELKANPNKRGKGTVIEAALDKGRGYVATILVQDGTISKGDLIIAGPVFGRVKAMFNERAKSVKSAGPSQPVLLLGLNGAPQAGDIFNVMKDEKEAKAIANKRQQLIREQNLRSQKHITLDEIGRRIAIGDFKELNIIVKGDVDGSVEALGDALLKLSTEEVQVNIIHKAVGAITESDILLASASDAIIIGFQVRPMPQARKLAEQEQIDIRLYSIIYQATEEIAAAIEGMLAPKMEEKITCNVEVREVFKITKVGTIAGCYVLDGKINRNTRVRLIRDGIVIYTGKLGSLKRFKDDVKEVASGYECGLNIENYNDIKVGDYIEGFEEVEVVRKK